ncbi:glucose/sorbosone dehydrogenase [Ralstonia pickettii OR214]|uniref:Glucose/sorbosone dehydrogenase n=1 Tax=Ralstonia pickettii OR214 TaxID=1264675 RepID=R0CP54_RALPI|nr:sorbosone dehydrogenase family protein [Ralstonia pickettii]ENZ78195.1 glucose/sorbosone dehydrogenase [Ralstonia pickettii OR214]OYU22823.1 MAG: sorbosone dehydrogenase [Ralstonia sp. PBBBR1]
MWPAVVLAAWLGAGPAALAKLPVESVRVPPGFHVEVLTDAMPAAREMALSPAGILYVGSRAGKVYTMSLQTPDAPIHVVASGLQLPVGVAWRDGNLYVSAVSRVLRLDGIDSRLGNPPDPVIVNDKLPTETHHGWKFIAFGPDGKLYVPVGAPCHICRPDENRYANLMRMNADGSRLELVARGIRNTVGFDWHPSTHELWFTDNGRDLMGDDVPDDELNRITKPNPHFGYPFCHAGDIPDPEFGAGHPCSDYTPPAARLGAHVAALGMRFYTGSSFPPEYRNNVLIAEHGSWNRSSKVGYRVVRVVLDAAGNVTKQEPFAQGWLQGERAWGRPADVLVAPDGSLLVSDDLADAVYRIHYTGK